jgi:UV DNA damage endonuclease
MNLGYACINMELSAQGVCTNRGMVKRTFQKRGKNYAGELAMLNLTDLKKVLEWNFLKGVSVYRMSSCLFPWMSEYEFHELENYEEIRKLCKDIGDYANATGQRLSFHPGHFDILASPHEKVVNASILDLDRHAQIMDMMELRTDFHNVINIHVGGAYGDKTSAMERFCTNYQRLQESARKRLTVENDDKGNLYSTKDLFSGVHEVIGIPIVFDYHHHSLCTGGQTEEEALRLAARSWPEGIKQLTHYSSSKKIYEDSKSNAQAHADHVYDKIEQYDLDIDIEVEAKLKEVAVFSYLEKFVI